VLGLQRDIEVRRVTLLSDLRAAVDAALPTGLMGCVLVLRSRREREPEGLRDAQLVPAGVQLGEVMCGQQIPVVASATSLVSGPLQIAEVIGKVRTMCSRKRGPRATRHGRCTVSKEGK
jgi:hypothetical protein